MYIIQPKKLKSLILDEIEYKGKESVQTRKALFKLVKHHATNLSFYYSAGSSSGFSSSRFENSSNSKTGIQCCYWKGNHKKRDCKQFGKSDEGYQRSNLFVSSNQSAKKFPARSFDARNKEAAEKKVDVASDARGDNRATKLDMPYEKIRGGLRSR